MTTQNLISASISAEKKASVLQKIGEIKGTLDFLLTLPPNKIQGMLKAGNVSAPFIEAALNIAIAHPQILPSLFDLEEFKRNFALAKDLTTITNQVKELYSSLQDTSMAAGSSNKAAALEIYSAVKLNRNRVLGLNVASSELAAFFKQSRKASSAKPTSAA